MHNPVPVAILGATGMVGQRMIERLAGHPWLRLVAVAASARSAGRPYGEAAIWRLPGELPEAVAAMPVLPCTPAAMPPGVRLVLSALDSGVAGEIEASFRDAGFAVVTNAGHFRMDPRVPLVIPEVNPHHLSLLDDQGPGFIVANANCCAIPLVMAMAPLHARFGVRAAVVSTWQAVSGAGYPGESAWDMIGNVHPHAGNEEEKLAIEPQKMLGSPTQAADFPVSARCVRVNTADGHLLSAHLRLGGDPDLAAVLETLQAWRGNAPPLPSCPPRPLRFTQRRDRPSPRFDADADGGMGVTVGRVEACPILGIKLFVLGHNTIRGAAGAAIANAELLIASGRI